MADLSKYDFRYLTENMVKREESFIDSYVNKFLQSESSMSLTHKIRRILDAKYEKYDLNKVITEQYHHFSPI